jgi:DcaP outer membrane protein
MKGHESRYRTMVWRAVVASTLLVGVSGRATAQGGQAANPQTPGDTTLRFEIFGFAQGDIGFDFARMDPKWFDVVRPTKLPSGPDEFGKNGNTFVGARQTRFGVRATKLTDYGDVKAVFDFDLFGVGPDAGQTTIRLRHAYGVFGPIIAGQIETPFMDLDVFPNILDYWGPSGMIFFRNVMLQYRPIDEPDGTRLEIALERPGASADAGDYAGRIELANVTPHFPWPDISASSRYGQDWGHVKLAGIWRSIRWDQVPADTFDLSGHANGWGVNLSGVVKLNEKKDALRLQAVYGEGIQNYFNDAPTDIGVVNQLGNLRTPITGEALPIFGAVVYYDHAWDSEFTSALGWSMTNITNSDGQAGNAFHNGQYASTNLLWTPTSNVMMGGELQYARRQNNFDGFDFDQFKLQFSFKYSYSQIFGGKP